MSQQLSALERETGVQLLERDGRRVLLLTPAARALVERGQRIVDDLDAAAAELHAARTTVEGEVRVGAFPSAATALVVPAGQVIAKRFPAVSLGILETDPADGLRLLRSGALDILVTYEYDLLTPLSDGGTISVHLLDDPVVVALPAGHRLAAAESIAIADLSGERWIAGLVGTAFGLLVQRACRAAGFEPLIAHRAREFRVQEALASAGLGIALLPNLGRTTDPPGGVRFVALRPPIFRKVHVTFRRGSDQRPAVAVTLRELTRASAGH
ncbi:LysR family transcriptional regulator [Fodinicola feengrottensis]|uniref:LysR family transcriptional regulator n=1 Tax=Fodinicola feengrottensis TaxID=435914 RepID=UPI0013D4FFC3|nr:LysR family transcriptional regulator [Fodinicola feengrottensis]